MARDDDKPDVAPGKRRLLAELTPETAQTAAHRAAVASQSSQQALPVGSENAGLVPADESDLELDLSAELADNAHQYVDDMEFDPRSIAPGAVTPSPASKVIGEVDLDFDDELVNETKESQGFSEGRYSISNHPGRHPSDPDLRRAIDQYPGRASVDFNLEPKGPATAMLSAPALPNLAAPGSTTASSVVPDLAVPDLEIPQPKSAAHSLPPGRERAAHASQRPISPSFELDFEGGASAHQSRPSVHPSARPSAHPSARPAGVSVRPAGVSVRPAASRSSYPKGLMPAQLGGTHDFSGDFSDLEFGASSRSAQLDVAVALPKNEDEVAWPLGRTPFDDELEISGDAVRTAGYGVVPTQLWGAAAYALHIWRTTAAIRARAREARHLLERCEMARDEQLAALAESQRAKTTNQERFVALYLQVDELSAQLRQKSEELETVDAQGATQLRAAEQLIATQKARCLELERERQAALQDVETQNTSVARLRALLQRLAIEERNLSARFDSGDVPEAQHAFQTSELKTRTEQAASELALEEQNAQHLKRALSQLDDELARATAEQQRQEAALEALMLAAEGESAEYSRALTQVRAARLTKLADIGRAIVELRGNVPVDATVRAALLRADEQVKTAALACRTLELALDSVDLDVYRLGRAIWVALALLALGGLTYLYGFSAP